MLISKPLKEMQKMSMKELFDHWSVEKWEFPHFYFR